ncbi:hypothetical protein KP745_04520 [Streptococcus equi subsp. equi]|uniref:hypothetical protein n=1 Tax=Streptococcus equi TaxID=1336 RepID=UPI001E35889D|nr:hypothetical protein [Streptococcus equi]MCD3536057.1 hypothetical protein [Streptococcus equi subsp. equi]
MVQMMMKPIKNNQDISIGDNVYLAFAALLVGVVVGVIDTVFGHCPKTVSITPTTTPTSRAAKAK